MSDQSIRTINTSLFIITHDNLSRIYLRGDPCLPYDRHSFGLCCFSGLLAAFWIVVRSLWHFVQLLHSWKGGTAFDSRTNASATPEGGGNTTTPQQKQEELYSQPQKFFDARLIPIIVQERATRGTMLCYAVALSRLVLSLVFLWYWRLGYFCFAWIVLPALASSSSSGRQASVLVDARLM